MRRVVYSLIPIFLFSTYLYGWRSVAVVAVVYVLGILTELVIEKTRNKKVSEAVLVTCGLYALSLPPAVPLWVAGVGIIFGVLIGKGVYGGFGRNIFNPAITGRLFIYITFPTLLQASWAAPGALGPVPDGITSATPMAIMKGTAEGSVDVYNLLFGFRAGTLGESAIILILAAAVYLMWTKTANWKLIVSTFVSAGVFSAVFYATGLSPIPPHMALMSGSILYVAVFMATDPVSAPNKTMSQWVYGTIIGSVSILIRTFAGFPEGTSFGILVANTFASLLDEIFPAPKRKKKKKTSTTQKSKVAAKESSAKEATA
jgi:Na+-transporting NADH:ubiquinone oxidoreductase subunit B